MNLDAGKQKQQHQEDEWEFLSDDQSRLREEMKDETHESLSSSSDYSTDEEAKSFHFITERTATEEDYALDILSLDNSASTNSPSSGIIKKNKDDKDDFDLVSSNSVNYNSDTIIVDSEQENEEESFNQHYQQRQQHDIISLLSTSSASDDEFDQNEDFLIVCTPKEISKQASQPPTTIAEEDTKNDTYQAITLVKSSPSCKKEEEKFIITTIDTKKELITNKNNQNQFLLFLNDNNTRKKILRDTGHVIDTMLRNVGKRVELFNDEYQMLDQLAVLAYISVAGLFFREKRPVIEGALHLVTGGSNTTYHHHQSSQQLQEVV